MQRRATQRAAFALAPHPLHAGGEGETWLCKEKGTGREVAIKLVRRPIPKSITQIIQREIKILADLGGAPAQGEWVP